MADNLLTLFCLVEGLPSSRAFEIEISPTSSIAGLKDEIKGKQTPAFDDITTDQLTLWHVSIPVDQANMHRPIFRKEFESSRELDPTDDISDVFKEKLPKKHIHVIVERPPDYELEFLQCVPTAVIGEQQNRGP
ncbi:hypothetical protein BGZ81_009469, partial [Podila clonocystis]